MAAETESPAKMTTAATAGYRKIELQEPEDLAFLIANVRRAAAESIAAAFPPVEDESKDELHARVEALVDEYITRIFTLAAPNLSINGMPITNVSSYLNPAASSAPTRGKKKKGAAAPEKDAEAYEPFDARARQRVEDLSREEEDLLRDLAALKRKVPASVAGQYAEAAEAALRADEERLAAAVAAAVAAPLGNKAGKEAITELERQADVEGAFAHAVETLGRLKGGMSATVATMERARVAGEYVVTER